MAKSKTPNLPPGFKAGRRHRSDDPETSMMAAIKAAKASRTAVEHVSVVMQDGLARVDEEIWAECRANGYLVTQDTIEHARLALAEAGYLADTKHTKITSNNSPARVWIWTGSDWYQQHKHLLPL